MSKVVLHCSICGNEIDPHSAKLHKLDPCGLYIVTNLLEDEDEKRLEQAFYAHYDCIKGTLVDENYLNLEGQDSEEG
jgi:hypothetical protein